MHPILAQSHEIWHTNAMLKNKKLLYGFYAITLILILYSSFIYFEKKLYWDLWINLEFIAMLVYMVFFYPKNPLKMGFMAFQFLLIHFVSYGIRGLMISNWIHVMFAVLYLIVYIVYMLKRRSKKIPIYFKPKR